MNYHLNIIQIIVWVWQLYSLVIYQANCYEQLQKRDISGFVALYNIFFQIKSDGMVFRLKG